MANFTPQELEEILQEFFNVTGKRQYIGARYVPIFGRKGESSIEWDNSAPYEPLTIVINNGVSYTSRKYVPAGIELNDTDYWAETYRFNAQVEQYRQEVLSFDSRISDNTAAIAMETENREQAIAAETESREQAIADVLTMVNDGYVPFPDSDTYPKYGESGQVLSTLTRGKTRWVDPVTVDAEIAGPLIDAWLDAHPEATTSIEDGSVIDNKFAPHGILDIVGARTTRFSVAAGASHSSLRDSINFFRVKSGTTLQILIKSTAQIAIVFTTFPNDVPQPETGTNIGTILLYPDEITRRTITLTSNIKSLGLYATEGVADAEITCIVTYDNLEIGDDFPITKKVNSVESQIANVQTHLTNIDDNIDSLKQDTEALDLIGARITKFNVASNSGHSSLADSINYLTLKNGSEIEIIFKTNAYATLAVFTFATPVPTAGQGNRIFAIDFATADTQAFYLTLTSDVGSIGIYSSAGSEPVDVMCIVKYDNLGVKNGLPLSKIEQTLLSLRFTNPIPYSVDFNSSISRRNNQGIAVYNGNVFDMGTGIVSVNGGEPFALTNGHGNNANFGTVLHGDYPYLYCPSWIQDDCKIYVNEVTNNSAALVRTIDFNLNGYLNAVVDEPNNLIYILLNVSSTTPEGVIDFIIANLSDGSIVSTTRLPYTIPVIQGMCLGNSCIYVAHGGVSPYTENHIKVLDFEGNVIADTANITGMIEIEAVYIDNGKFYVGDGSKLYTADI